MRKGRQSVAVSGLFLLAIAPCVGSAASHGMQGHAHGGYGPLVGSTVTLYSTGSTGYGSAGAVLGSTTTDASGNFTLNSYTCPAGNSMTYLTAVGGKSGSVTTANPSIRLVLGTGACASLPATTIINELSTVASVYALTRFTNPTTLTIGAPSTNEVGLTNAFALIGSLYNISLGTAGQLYAPPGVPSVAVEKFNSLADILVSCVNSAGPFAACTSLFADASSSTGVTPTNTEQATLNIALSPANKVPELFAQQARVVGPLPYTPALTSAPNQWLLAAFHSLGTGTQPEELAVDGSGNLYIADHGTSGSNGGVIMLTPAGGAIPEFTTDASSPFGVAVASNGNIWVTNDINGTLVEYSPTGAVVVGPISGLTTPRTVALDQTGNVWVANTGANSVLEFSSTGTLLNTFKSNAIKEPFDLAVDASGIVWSANEASNTISMISGTTVTSFPGNGLSMPKGIIINNLGNVWVGDYDATTRISEFTPTGNGISNYTDGGTGRVLRLASDGSGNIWASDVDTHALTELTPGGVALSPAAGFVAHSLIEAPQSIAIDPSGNVWVSDLMNTGVAEFVGAAAPVKTPVIGPPLLP